MIENILGRKYVSTELRVADALDDAARELVHSIGQRDVAEHRRAIDHDLVGRDCRAAATIAEAFLVVGNPEAAAAELLRFAQAFALDLGERARAIAHRDELALDAVYARRGTCSHGARVATRADWAEARRLCPNRQESPGKDG